MYSLFVVKKSHDVETAAEKVNPFAQTLSSVIENGYSTVEFISVSRWIQGK